MKRHYKHNSSNVTIVRLFKTTIIFSTQVLLLEAGIEEPLVADVPAFAPALRGSNVDWQYRTTRMKKACRSKRRGTCSWSRGKVRMRNLLIHEFVLLCKYLYQAWNKRLLARKPLEIYHNSRGASFPYSNMNHQVLLRSENCLRLICEFQSS